MNTLSIDTGFKTYGLRAAKSDDVVEVSFNPSDTEFINRLYEAFSEADRLQKGYEAELESAGEDFPAVMEIMRRKDKEIRAAVDSVFNNPVCDSLFPKMNIFSMGVNGVPVWANMLMAIIDVCDADSAEMHSKQEAHIKKYVDKYRKKYHR